MNYATLALRMVRYRSALVLILFMLAGAVWHGVFEHGFMPLVLGAFALAAAYACSTCINDLADWKIDQVNLQGHSDRPLITGSASRTDLIRVAAGASCIALACGFMISFFAAILVALLLVMNVCYSLPPFRVSHRALLTPIYLVAGYAAIPYALGAVAVGQRIGYADAIFLPALCFLFLARISLKDFRDRVGDAINNKPTILLKYGKSATCRLSATALVVGGAFLLISVAYNPLLQLFLTPYLAALAITEFNLATNHNRFSELISIGMGARIGNGMMFILLGMLLLKQQNVPSNALIIFYASVTLLYAVTFWDYLREPGSFQFGNRPAKQHGLPQT